MSEELDAILRSDTKGMENTTGVLSRLVRKTFFALNLKPIQWQNKMNRYLSSKACAIPLDDLSKRSSFKGNLDKAIIKPEMTWEVFLTVIAVLGAKSSVLKFKLNYPATEDKIDTSSEHYIDLKRAGKASLVNVFQNILTYYKVRPSQWNDLMTRYIHKTNDVRPGDNIHLSWLKGNIKTKIRARNLSIKNFTTILAILDPVSVEMTLELGWQSGVTTIHSITFSSRDTFGDIVRGNKDETV